MCGIAGIYIRSDKVLADHDRIERMVDALLLEIEARGTHATGFVAITRDGKAVIDKDAKKASEFIETREAIPHNVRSILLHTRFTTKGSEKDNLNNHPVLWGSCYTTHNGAINNDDDLFKEHGYKRHGEVDTEIIAAHLGNTDFSTEQIKEALGHFRGNMAIAVVDPIKFPNKVLLAKGDSSPLNIIDRGDYVIWASLSKSIEDAWGNVIGTPPAKKNIKFLPAFKYLILNEEGVEEGDFPRPPVVTRSYGFSEGHSGVSYRNRLVERWHPVDDILSHLPPNERYVGNYVDKADIKAECEALRRAKKGKALLWVERFNSIVPVDMGVGPWSTCTICDVMVHKEDTILSVRGDLCVDCRDIWKSIIYEKNKDRMPKPAEVIKPPTPSESVDDIDYAVMDSLMYKDVCSTFNDWAQDEDWIHSEVLKDMSRNLTLDPQSLDFLLFRAGEKELEDGGDNLKLFVEIGLEIYDQLYTEMWAEVSDEENPRVLTLLPAEPAQKQLTMAKEPQGVTIVTPAPKKKGTCCFCKHKARLYLRCHTSGHDIPYCADHFENCGTKGCRMEANYTRMDGIRVCHTHARGTKGYSDTILEERGFTVGV